MSDTPSLHDLDAAAPFATRHIGPGPGERQTMLDALGYASLDELMAAAVPSAIRSDDALSLPPPVSEPEAIAQLRRLAGRNNPGVAMIGMGYHPTATPAVIRRNVLEDPRWYTAYTPYQPEISQGRLEALLNFQTMVADLTGLPTANASLLDEGTAVAEAVGLVRRAQRSSDKPFLVDADLAPQSLAVLQTRAEAVGIDLRIADLTEGMPDGDAAAVVVAYPGVSGVVPDLRQLL